jgi:uncharacterized protein YjbI with pentapeptide repeats
MVPFTKLRVELIHEEEARRINRSIHLKYVMPEALNDVRVSSYIFDQHPTTCYKEVLQFANLYGATLMGVNVCNANLRHAVLKYANLEEAKIVDSSLEYAYLDRADLQYADLTNSSLRYASMSCADRETILTGTILYEARFTNISKECRIERSNFRKVARCITTPF